MIGCLLLFNLSASADSAFESLARKQLGKLKEAYAKAPSGPGDNPEFAAWRQDLDRLKGLQQREVLEFVEEHPEDWEVPSALFYAISLLPDSEGSQKAWSRLDDYLDHPSLAVPLLEEGRYATPEKLEWIGRAESKTHCKQVRSAAQIALAKAFLQKKEVERAKQLLQSCLKDPELKIGDFTVRSLAEGPLYEASFLQVGMPFPSLRGEDLQGATLSLDDYQGKVVLVEFWASWCAPCRRLLPENRKLLEKYAARGFALVGINGDSYREAVKAFEQENQILWPSFWQGAEGEISRRFNQTAWPTLYLLDRGGRICFRDIRGDWLDQAVESLLGEP